MPNNVAATSAAVDHMRPDWDVVTALLGGTRAMRAAGSMYLPKFTNESSTSHETRLATSTLFPALKRTVEVLASKPFSKPVVLDENLDERIKEWLDNCDLQGRNLDAFASCLMEDALGPGLAGILVEHPRRPEGVVTQADEARVGMRPYFVHIRCQQILGWHAEVREGEWRLTQLRLMEEVEEPDPENIYLMKAVEQVRLLEIGKWTTFRKKYSEVTKAVDWVPHEEGMTTLTVIPFVPVYGHRLGFMMSKPPLIELARLNIKHWQSQSDQDNLLRVARVPILTVSGVDEKFALVVGASVAVKLPMNAKLEYTEHTGSAIGAGRVALEDLKGEMQQAGAEMLVLATGGPKTATEVATDNAVGMCHLQRVVQWLEDSLDLALSYMGLYVGTEVEGNVELFDDFAAATLAEASAQLLLTMSTSGKLSDETLFAEFQRRGIISGDVDFEEERDRIDGQGPAEGKIDPLTGLPHAAPVSPLDAARIEQMKKGGAA